MSSNASQKRWHFVLDWNYGSKKKIINNQKRKKKWGEEAASGLIKMLQQIKETTFLISILQDERF